MWQETTDKAAELARECCFFFTEEYIFNMSCALEIGCIGVGKLGGNLAVQLARATCAVRHVYSRHPVDAVIVAREISAGVSPSLHDIARKSDVLIISVPDAQLDGILESLSELPAVRATFLLHTSGSIPAHALNWAGMDFLCASMHPLAGFSHFDPQRNLFANIPFGVEGHPLACELANSLIAKVGGKAIAIDSRKKTTYHFAAALAANSIFGIIAQAERLLIECGLANAQAQAVVSSLIMRVFENYTDYGLTHAITGPLVRDDVLTLCAHFDCAREHNMLEQYCSNMRVVAQAIDKVALFEHVTHCTACD